MERFYGEIWMTVAFSPSRGAVGGRSIAKRISTLTSASTDDKSLATPVSNKPKPIFVGLVPPEHKNPGTLYESYQIEKLRKWAPVRTYHGDLGEKGEKGDRWRLKLQLLTRHEARKQVATRPQPFSLIVTIADPEKKVRVYDEMARLVRNRFQAQNLTVRAATRVQAKDQ